MLKTRVIPTLLLKEDSLVKTVRFKKARYIGDPINTVRIFNELEVDELVFLDITATNEKRKPNIKILKEIANECFMPLSYGGGLNDFNTIQEIFNIGFEKVILNTACYTKPDLIHKIATNYGNQAIVASVDVKKNFWGKYETRSHSGKINTKKNPMEWCLHLENLGIGEILITSMDKEGTWSGFDLELTQKISEAVSIPVIAHGGAGNIQHIKEVVHTGKASAVALGSMVVYQQKGLGVLVNFPDKNTLSKVLV